MKFFTVTTKKIPGIIILFSLFSFFATSVSAEIIIAPKVNATIVSAEKVISDSDNSDSDSKNLDKATANKIATDNTTADVLRSQTSVGVPQAAVNNFKNTNPVPQKISSSSQLANLLGGLALILALIFVLSWFVKRFSQGGFLQNPTMKIVSTMPLGTRERLMLVDVGGKQILLGITATQINNLHVFDQPVVVEPDKTSIVTSDFSKKLVSILQQKK